MASRRRSDTDIRRRAPRRQPKERILIVCEGRVTEKEYFHAFKVHFRNPRIHVEVADETGVPLTVVEIAVRKRREADEEARAQHDENLRWDQVWGVFDVDDHPNLDKALDLARREKIDVAVSNPCFELWALLHFQDQQAHVARERLRRVLRKYLPEYEKRLDFKRMHSGFDSACARAKQLGAEAERHGDAHRNPSTGVYRLTEALRAS